MSRAAARGSKKLQSFASGCLSVRDTQEADPAVAPDERVLLAHRCGSKNGTACLYVAVPFTTASPASSTRSIGDASFVQPSPLALTDNRISAYPEARRTSPCWRLATIFSTSNKHRWWRSRFGMVPLVILIGHSATNRRIPGSATSFFRWPRSPQNSTIHIMAITGTAHSRSHLRHDKGLKTRSCRRRVCLSELRCDRRQHLLYGPTAMGAKCS